MSLKCGKCLEHGNLNEKCVHVAIGQADACSDYECAKRLRETIHDVCDMGDM